MMPSEKSGHNATQAEDGTPIACVPSDASTQKEKNKLVRRALSMPRNLFRLSRRVKLTSTTKTSAYKNAAKSDTNPITTDHSASETTCGTDTDNVHVQLNESSEAPTMSDKSLQSKRNRLFHRSTWKRFLTRVAQQMTSNSNAQKRDASHSANGRVPSMERCAWPPDRIPGVVGLQNHGNTCFMNAVLQCLSHTDILAEYFVLDQYKADLKRRNKINSRKFGTKGELTEQLALVLKALWTCNNESDYSTNFKAVVDRYGSQFRSSTQHDAQEFLFWLLDKVHEDLNTALKRKYKPIKNNYGRSDEVMAAETLANHIRCNNSFVQAVFQAQFRSSLSCPRCHKQSNTFDPFHCISVQLPQLAQQAVFVTVLYAKKQPRQVRFGLNIPTGLPIIALREQLQADTGISLDRMILTEIQASGFVRVFCDSQPISAITPDDSIYCIEIAGSDDSVDGVGFGAASTKKAAAGTTTTTSTTATATTATTATTTTTANQCNDTSTNLTLVLSNAKRLSSKDNDVERFAAPICVQVNRDISYSELQKCLLREMRAILRSDVFAYATPLSEMFKIRLQDASADPDTYIESHVEHPLFTEMIDLALSVLPADAGPQHVKLLLEWTKPDDFFCDTSDVVVEHESVSRLQDKITNDKMLTLEQCLEHYTKAETLSAEDAWRCPHCQKYLPVVKTLGLWSLPDILVIHFKRFRQQQSKEPQSAKLTTTVTFPLNDFDMTPHLARESAGAFQSSGTAATAEATRTSRWSKPKRRDTADDARNNCYDLYAVCYHKGDTLETGHYTAACKNPYDSQWYRFDDQHVTVVPADRVPDDIVNNEAYMLFYQRRKSDSLESTSNSSSNDHWLSRITVAPKSSKSSATISSTSIKESIDADDRSVNGATDPTHSLLNEEIRAQEQPADSIDASASGSEAIAIVVEAEPAQADDFIDIECIEEDSANCVEATPELADIDDMEAQADVDILAEDDASDHAECNGEDEKHFMPVAESLGADSSEDDIDVEVELRNNTEPKKADAALSVSFPVETWRFDYYNTFHSYTPLLNRGSLNFGEMLTKNLSCGRNYNLRHSLSTSLGQHSSDTSADKPSGAVCSMRSLIKQQQQQQQKHQQHLHQQQPKVRGVNSCSKDTIIFIDQQNQSLINDDSSFLSNQPLWISPVTPHKLITVSPKN